MFCMKQADILCLLNCLYGSEKAASVAPRLVELIERHRGRIPVPQVTELTERDAMLITYGDQIQLPGQSHLKTLEQFCNSNIRKLISSIHILPFFPWSSDDGFAVMDYRSVDPVLGDWCDVEHLAQSFRLMFDGVINHMSSRSDWFKSFLKDAPPYRDYFLTVQGDPDLSAVVRPRTLPLVTEFQTSAGLRRVWTTFSADQVDLDYHNPEVLLEIIDVLLEYACHGAQFIRLDAIAYLWKEIGTTCLHLPQTHGVIQLFRAVLNDVAPFVRIITETNVPHAENISYFGNGENEASLVYNFALPPLVLHTLQTEDSSKLSNWAAGLDLPSNSVTFFNFLASHDGIGLNPVRGILTQQEIDALVHRALKNGGLISYKNNPDGTKSPYEMNINYFDALSDPSSDEPVNLQVDRFMASQAILLAMRGLPGIYFHSLFGSRGWLEGVKQSGQNRSINRQKLELLSLMAELNDAASLRAKVFSRYRELLLRRAASSAFHPNGGQRVLDYGRSIFALLRTSPDGRHSNLCLQNITAETQSAAGYQLSPYQTLWIDQK